MRWRKQQDDKQQPTANSKSRYTAYYTHHANPRQALLLDSAKHRPHSIEVDGSPWALGAFEHLAASVTALEDLAHPTPSTVRRVSELLSAVQAEDLLSGGLAVLDAARERWAELACGSEAGPGVAAAIEALRARLPEVRPRNT